ncbi:dTDP-4-dehydrorhamnose reductase [bacterium]|nr:dTDP-4-dehydrorhamnose reductase [bacterium]
MKLLVVGADGQLGSDVVRLLSPTVEVTALVMDELDVTDRAGLRQAVESVRPDVVVNCAAWTAVDRAETEQDAAYRVNVLGAANVAQAARRVGARVVYFSSDYVFDGTATQPYDEDAPTGPLSVYGRTKLLGEQATREANPDHLILRLAWLYGRSGHNFVRTVLRLARTKDQLRIVDDQVGCPTFTEDVVHQLWTAIEEDCSGTYHCVNTGRASWYGFATHIVHRLGLNIGVIPIQTVDYPSPARRPAFSVLADRKFDLEQLNVMRPWEDALDDCLLRYREELSHD